VTKRSRRALLGLAVLCVGAALPACGSGETRAARPTEDTAAGVFAARAADERAPSSTAAPASTTTATVVVTSTAPPPTTPTPAPPPSTTAVRVADRGHVATDDLDDDPDPLHPTDPPAPPVAPPPSTTAAGPATPRPAPEAQNEPGHFSGRISRDGAPLPGVTVKVVNVETPGWPRGEVLDTLGGHDGIDVFVTTTDGTGSWSVRGVAATKQFMLKVFPPSLCDAFAEIAAKYTTAEAGFINSHWQPFMSTRAAPASDSYFVWSSNRYLFDMPVHIHPTVPGALEGAKGYNDLDIRFFTRGDTFSTIRGTRSGCPAGG
jgi:hypothetical protein